MELGRGTKVYINGPGHTTKMADGKRVLLQNQKVYNLETWHVASGSEALKCLYINHDLEMALAYFTARFWLPMHLNGKKL